MKKHILLFLLFSMTTSLFAQIKESKSVDDIFSAWNKNDVPGCALGIIKDGELIYAKGYGFANLEYNIPNSAASVFRIASTSKQFTAACIVLLAEQGKLSLDDKLNKFFPDFPAYAKDISIRHLLNHTSGVRDYLTISYLKAHREDEYYEDKDIMKWLINQSELNFKPGDEHLYSNSGYWLLGKIVDQIAGMNMADFAEKEIFKPLGMSSTHFHNDHTRVVKNRASGYLPSGNESYQISMTTLNMIGDGGIFTSINDIKKWDDAYYDTSVLSKDFWNMMTEKGSLNNGDKIDYASGLGIGNYKGLKTISHGGAFVGFRAELVRFPEQRFSVAIFTNRGDANPTRMAYQVADLFLKEKFIQDEVEEESEIEIKEPKSVQLKTNELKSFTGHYWNETNSLARKIYLKNDTLRYARSETNESDLVPISKNEFEMINVGGGVFVKFEINGEGKKTMAFIAGGNEPSISTEYQPKVYTKQELNNFAGTYFSKELDINYTLKLEGNSLMLFINKNKISPLQPIMMNLFKNDNFGILKFKTDANGKVDDFRLAAGRVKNLVFEKK